MPDLHVAAGQALHAAARVLLLALVQDGKHTLGGGFDVLDIAQAPSDVLQRARKLADEEDDRDHGADGQAALPDEPAAEDGHGDIGQRVHERDDRLDDRGQEVSEDPAVLVLLGERVIFLLQLLLPVEGLGGGVVGVGLLRQGGELAPQLVVAVPVLLP